MKYICSLFIFAFLSSLSKFECIEEKGSVQKSKISKSSLKIASEASSGIRSKTENKVESSSKGKSESESKLNKASETAKTVNSATNTATTAVGATTKAQTESKDQSKIKDHPKEGVIKKEVKVMPKSSLNTNLALPEAETYYQGWARYYHYSLLSRERITKPKLFFQNDMFFHQRIKKPNQHNKDEFGSLAIPNKAAFFMILYNNTLSVFNNRDDLVRREVDLLHVDNINPIPEDNLEKGGIKDLGIFPTGSCVEINTKIPTSMGGPEIPTVWLVCFDQDRQNRLFRKMLAKLKIRHQRLHDFIPLTVDKLKLHESMADHFKGGPGFHPIPPEKQLPVNGYWILMQDWTDCTLACGGGWHYQQWMCIPPKFGGLDCQGDAIRRRPCNTQPCPPAKDILNKNSKLLHLPIVNKPEMHVGRFSARPQRYSKCLIKENDAYLTEYDEKKKIKKKVPVRIVMNNRTISIFQDDDYSDMMFTFKLENTNYLHSDRFCCFGLKDNQKERSVCGYPENCGENRDKNVWANGWKEDFFLFKVLCKSGMEPTMLDNNDLNKFNDTGLADPLGIDVDAVRRRKKQLKDEILDDKDKIYKKNIQDTQELGFKAIQREFDIENMIKKEEKAKEDADLMDIEDKIKKEEKKAKCIHNQIEEKELDDDWEEKLEADEEMDRLKKKINVKIDTGRQRIRELLGKMRKKAKLRKADAMQRLQAIRAKMASEIMLANKEGSYKPCIKGRTDADFRETYCNKNFVEYYVINNSCKDPEQYCYTCCENEFGNAFRLKRTHCYNLCDAADRRLNNEKKADGDEGIKQSGEWQWAPVHEVKEDDLKRSQGTIIPAR